jgi:hypothetical protein
LDLSKTVRWVGQDVAVFVGQIKVFVVKYLGCEIAEEYQDVDRPSGSRAYA